MISCLRAFLRQSLPECSEALQTFRYSIRVLCTLPTVGRRSIKCQFVFMFQPQRGSSHLLHPRLTVDAADQTTPSHALFHIIHFQTFKIESRCRARMSSPSRAQSKRANLLKLLSDIESLEANLKVSLPRTFLPLLPPKPFTFIHDYICRFSQ